MNPRKTFIYFGVPFILTLPLIALYFSGIPALQQLITPNLPDLYPNAQREFGLLENLQNLLLLVMFAAAILGFRNLTHPIKKTALAGVAAFTILVFLEEIDYGLHYYELVMGIPSEEAAEVRNWHNQGDRTQKTKMAVDILMVLVFMIAPFAFSKSKNAWIQYFTPDKYAALTVIAAFLVRTLAHFLRDLGLGEGGTIQANISEFREVVTYYVFLLYVIQLGFRNAPSNEVAPPAPADTHETPVE